MTKSTCNRRFSGFFFAIGSLGFLFLGASLAQAVTLSITGTVPRNIPTTLPSFTLTISGIDDAAEGDEKYMDRVKVTAAALDDDVLKVEGSGDTSNSDYVIVVESEDVTTSQDDGETEYKAVIKFEIKENSGGDMRKAIVDDNGGKLTLKIEYNDDEVDDEEISATFTRSTKLANEAPTGISLVSSNEKLIANWDKRDSITHSDGSSQPPEGVSFFVTEKNTGLQDITAYLHDPDAESDSATETCSIDTTVADGNSCVTCTNDASAYIDTANLPSHVLHGSADNEASRVSVDDLEEGVEYIGFLIFEPSGLVRSSCYSGIPIKTQTWSELADGDIDADKINPVCFIATAAYGTAFHDDIEVFRKFRNEVLLTNAPGRWLVEQYYTYSPAIADTISQRPWLKTAVRWTLWPWARLIEAFSSR